MPHEFAVHVQPVTTPTGEESPQHTLVTVRGEIDPDIDVDLAVTNALRTVEKATPWRWEHIVMILDRVQKKTSIKLFAQTTRQ